MGWEVAVNETSTSGVMSARKYVPPTTQVPPGHCLPLPVVVEDGGDCTTSWADRDASKLRRGNLPQRTL
jgi:hypothetical protein